MPETTPLFQTQTTYTFAEYRRYSRALQNKVMHRPLVIAVMMACLVLAIIPIIVFYLVCQKYIVSGVMAGAVKG